MTEEIYLQSVIVKKPISLALARLRAQKYIKKKGKTYFQETEDSFRFRNLPAKHFDDLIEKKINDEIFLVVGHLNAKAFGQSDLETKQGDDSCQLPQSSAV